MPLFAIVTLDAPGSDEARATHREGHLAHFHDNAKDIAVAGPIFNDEGASKGSLVILRSESADAARAWIERDPFHPAGVWQSIDVSAFKAASGDWAA